MQPWSNHNLLRSVALSKYPLRTNLTAELDCSFGDGTHVYRDVRSSNSHCGKPSHDYGRVVGHSDISIRLLRLGSFGAFSLPGIWSRTAGRHANQWIWCPLPSRVNTGYPQLARAGKFGPLPGTVYPPESDIGGKLQRGFQLPRSRLRDRLGRFRSYGPPPDYCSAQRPNTMVMKVDVMASCYHIPG